MGKHTPTPWKCKPISNRITNHNRGFEISGPETEWHVRDVLPEEIEANCARIEACVHALDGISTEAIEAGAVKDMRDFVSQLSDPTSKFFWEVSSNTSGYAEKLVTKLKNTKGK